MSGNQRWGGIGVLSKRIGKAVSQRRKHCGGASGTNQVPGRAVPIAPVHQRRSTGSNQDHPRLFKWFFAAERGKDGLPGRWIFSQGRDADTGWCVLWWIQPAGKWRGAFIPVEAGTVRRAGRLGGWRRLPPCKSGHRRGTGEFPAGADWSGTAAFSGAELHGLRHSQWLFRWKYYSCGIGDGHRSHPAAKRERFGRRIADPRRDAAPWTGQIFRRSDNPRCAAGVGGSSANCG